MKLKVFIILLLLRIFYCFKSRKIVPCKSYVWRFVIVSSLDNADYAKRNFFWPPFIKIKSNCPTFNTEMILKTSQADLCLLNEKSGFVQKASGKFSFIKRANFSPCKHSLAISTNLPQSKHMDSKSQTMVYWSFWNFGKEDETEAEVSVCTPLWSKTKKKKQNK